MLLTPCPSPEQNMSKFVKIVEKHKLNKKRPFKKNLKKNFKKSFKRNFKTTRSVYVGSKRPRLACLQRSLPLYIRSRRTNRCRFVIHTLRHLSAAAKAVLRRAAVVNRG